jgi:hypothetical protein
LFFSQRLHFHRAACVSASLEPRIVFDRCGGMSRNLGDKIWSDKRQLLGRHFQGGSGSGSLVQNEAVTSPMIENNWHNNSSQMA